MIRPLRNLAVFILANVVAAIVTPAAAQSAPPTIGIVVMHGKGGSPAKHVAGLASALEGRGYLVANLEMPWSGRRNYDAGVVEAERQVESALDGLRGKGATKLFVAGHSQGGLFALHFGGKGAVDGIVAIAPGGNVGSAVFREKLACRPATIRACSRPGRRCSMPCPGIRSPGSTNPMRITSARPPRRSTR